MKKRTLKTLIFDCVLFALGVFYCVGSKLVFHACDHKKPDGTWMSCHWAEQAVFAFGIVLAVQGLLLLVLSDTRTKRGIALAMIPTAVVPAFIPNVLINLCMSKDMQCHSVMRPAVIVLGAVIAVACCAYIFINKEKD